MSIPLSGFNLLYRKIRQLTKNKVTSVMSEFAILEDLEDVKIKPKISSQ